MKRSGREARKKWEDFASLKGTRKGTVNLAQVPQIVFVVISDLNGGVWMS